LSFDVLIKKNRVAQSTDTDHSADNRKVSRVSQTLCHFVS